MYIKYFFLIVLCLLFKPLDAQHLLQNTDTRGNHFATDSIEKEDVPEGIYAWTIDSRFGSVRPANYDTIPHLFPNEAFTEGIRGHYNFTGNLGAPRLSRIFTDRTENSFRDGQFLFSQPFDFFLRRPDQVLFTNTKSPFTNLTYHECGNKQNGEDRISALFSTNVNQQLGLGFKLDYLYGRGYYDSQATSAFNGTLFGSYRSDHYSLHSFFAANHLKIRENGGIETDAYVTSPESFPTRYDTDDMPINLARSNSKQQDNTFFLTHRYSIGLTRWTDKNGKIVSTRADRAATKVTTLTDSTQQRTNVDSLKLTPHFVPVTSLIHTLRMDFNNRRFISDAANGGRSFFNDYYLNNDSARDKTNYTHVENLVALEINEGFNRWVKTGMRLFAKHEYYRFTLPDTTTSGTQYVQKYLNHYITLGAQLMKKQGRVFHYDVLGDIRSNGSNWGEFNIEGTADVDLPLWKDTVSVRLDGFIRNEQPNFYLRHFHARNAWWDKDLDNQLTVRLGGSLSWKNTRFSFHLQNIQKLAYFAETLTPSDFTNNVQHYTHSIGVQQNSGSVQLLTASLRQDFHLGILHWENELIYQATTDKDSYPLPAFSVWTNLYLKFRLARVLQTELGADMRYFTKYYAPAYSPIMGQYAIQDPNYRIQLGNYPIINAYVNFHLKRTRFYVMASHVNYSSGAGNPFLVPHYPLNRLVLRLGISWNFIN